MLRATLTRQGMEMAVVPVFQSEIVPVAVRGLAVGSYQMSFGIGGFVISGLAHRTSTIPNDWSWRIIFLCYLFGKQSFAGHTYAHWQYPPSSPRSSGSNLSPPSGWFRRAASKKLANH